MRAGFYRYGGQVVKLTREGNLVQVRPLGPKGKHGDPLRGRQPDPLRALARLPRRFRDQIAKVAREADLAERYDKLGLSMPKNDVWTDLGKVA